MRNKYVFNLMLTIALCFTFNVAYALDPADLITGTGTVSRVDPNTVKIQASTANIDTYHWGQYNIGAGETAFYQFMANGQTAVNYLTPGANPSVILGNIKGSTDFVGNILLFNPNGITIGTGSNITNFNSFFASTNQFKGVAGNNVLFSEPSITNALNVNGPNISNVANAHFVAPGVIFNATNIAPKNSFSARVIGGGEYNTATNTFSNETAATKPVITPNAYSIDFNGSVKSNDITIESKTDYAQSADILFNGTLEATKTVEGKNGSVYLLADNSSSADYAGSQMVLNGTIKGNEANTTFKADRVCLNGDIDVSGAKGGSVNINTECLDQNGNILAKGTTGDGGNVNIRTTTYTAVKDSTIDVSSHGCGGNGGTIDIAADYQILSSGTYKATSDYGLGGKIKVTAPLNKLFGVNLDSSGYTGGGNLYIGGAGTSNEAIETSLFNVFSDASIAKANCLGPIGKAGNIYFDSDYQAYVFGNIQAKGSGLPGTGGFIEVSSKEGLGFNANIDTGGGTFLLDPKNIIITDTAIGAICYNSLLTNGSSLPRELDLSRQDHFGWSVGLTDHLLAVGANNDNPSGSNRGAVYLFSFTSGSDYSNLVFNQKLTNGTAGSNNKFGSAIALTNSLLAVGDYRNSTAGTQSGAVFLYYFDYGSTYSNLTLLPSSPLTRPTTNGANFGSSLAIYNPTATGGNALLAVGAPGDNTGVSNAGAVYLYRFDSGTNYDNLAYNTIVSSGTYGMPLPLSGGDKFGSSVALYDPANGLANMGLLAIGSSGHTEPGKNSCGAAYLFSFNSNSVYGGLDWNQTLTDGAPITGPGGITSLSLSGGDFFGSSVALSGYSTLDHGLLAVGAQGYNGSVNSGAVYLFDFATSSADPYGVLNLNVANPSIKDGTTLGTYTFDLPNQYFFGCSVAMINGKIVVGSWGDSKDIHGSSYPNTGAVYLLKFTPDTAYGSLAFCEKIMKGTEVGSALVINDNELFGSSVGLTNRLLAVGAPGNSEAGANRGAAYLFSFDLNTTYTNLMLDKKLTDSSTLLLTDLSLSNYENFGSSIAVTNGYLAIGASGYSNPVATTGNVYLYNFDANSAYTNLDLKMSLTGTAAGDRFGSSLALYTAGATRLLGIGASGLNSSTGQVTLRYFTTTDYTGLTTGNTLNGTTAGDNFGSGIALTGNLLAVGASGYTINSKSACGADYLYSFSGGVNPFVTVTANPTVPILTDGTLTGLTLTAGESFGKSTALIDRTLVVGAPGYSSNSGKVYLFNYASGTTFNNLSVLTDLKNGTTIPMSPSGEKTLSIAANDGFGSGVALTSLLLAVGSSGYTGGTYKGAVYLFSFLDQSVIGTNYADYPTSTIFISPAQINTLLLTNDVYLQANNDITVLSAITPATTSRSLTLEAGRSIDIRNNISTFNANLYLVANQDNTTMHPPGPIHDNRDTGAATITMQSGTSINAGTGTASISIKPGLGSDPLKYESGDITLQSVSAGAINIYNQGTTTGSDVLINGPLTTNVSGLTVTSTGSIIQDAASLITLNSSSFGSFSTTNGDIDLYGNLTGSGGVVTLNSGRNANIGSSVQTAAIVLNTGGGLFDVNATGNINVVSSNSTPTATTTVKTAGGDIELSGFDVNIGSTSQVAQVVMNTESGGDFTVDANESFNMNAPIPPSAATTDIFTYGGVVDIEANELATATNSVIYMSSGTKIDTSNGLLPRGDVTIALDATGTGSDITLNNITGKAITVNNNETTTNADIIMQGTLIEATAASSFTALTGDITQNSTAYLNGVAPGTDFTMSAGKSILLDGNILTYGGDFTGTANTGSHAGEDAEFKMGTSAKIDTSNPNPPLNIGDVSITLNTNPDSGDITLEEITANVINVYNNGTKAGSDVIVKDTLQAKGTSVTSNITATGKIDFENTAPCVFNGNLSMSATGGNISQTTSGNGIQVDGTTSLTTTGTNIINLNNEKNDFIGAVSAHSGGATTIYDANDLDMGTSVIGGALTLKTGFTTGGIITQTGGTLDVTGKTYLTAGKSSAPATITLDNGGNNFRDEVYIYVGDTSRIADTDALAMGSVDIIGDLYLTANGKISQSDFTSILVDKTTTLAAGTGNDIELDHSTNDFGLNVIISNANNVSLGDSNDLNFGASGTIAGTLTAASGQDINVNGAVTAANSINFIAGKGIGINADLTSTSGNIIMTGNNGTHAGNAANINMKSGTTISALGGNIDIELIGKFQADPGTITLSNIIGKTIFARNQSLTTGTDLVVRSGSTITETSTTAANPLILISDGGNFINSAGAGALVTSGDRRWLVYTGSPADTTLGGLLPVNTYYSSTFDTVPPTSPTIAAGNSVLYRTPIGGDGGGGGGGGGAGGIIAGGVVGGAAGGGALAASLSPLLLAGLAPNTVLAAAPLYLLESPITTGAAAPIKGPTTATTGAAASIAEDAQKYKFYYDNEKNMIIWVDSAEPPPVNK